MVIHHGSGAVSEVREFRYAREMVEMGVAAFVIDSFKPRGIVDTVSDQGQVSTAEMVVDAVLALETLATHPRLDATRIGIVGFSKGGIVALRTAMERYTSRTLSPGLRYALHVPMYPGCDLHQLRPKMTGAPIYMLLGGEDTYAGVAPCTEQAEKLKAAGARIEVKIYPGAGHAFDWDTTYHVAKGENWSKCIFEEQPDGTYRDRMTGEIVADAHGKTIEEGRAKALAACRTYGVSGGLHAPTRAAALVDLKTYVRRHLLAGR